MQLPGGTRRLQIASFANGVSCDCYYQRQAGLLMFIAAELLFKHRRQPSYVQNWMQANLEAFRVLVCCKR
jgi:hypothetical protein